PWQCNTNQSCSTLINGANGTAVGTGAQNTIDIVNGYSGVSIAARVCDQLALNTYTDWFLPSKDELNLLFQQRNTVGGFSSNLYEYWSSTQSSSDKAWYQAIEGNGSQDTTYKSHTFNVRAIRTF